MRGRGDPGARPVTRGQDVGEIGCGKTAFTHVDQGADDIPDLMPEKSVSLEFEQDHAAFPGNPPSGDRPDGGTGYAP